MTGGPIYIASGKRTSCVDVRSNNINGFQWSIKKNLYLLMKAIKNTLRKEYSNRRKLFGIGKSYCFKRFCIFS